MDPRTPIAKTYDVECQGEVHMIALGDDGHSLVLLDHDPEAERIAAELGAELPTCMVLYRKFDRQWAHLDVLLPYAVLEDQPGLVELVLDLGADVDMKRGEALRYASRMGLTRIVKLLLDRGANIHAWGDAAIQLAAKSGHLSTVALLLDRCADVHHGNELALRWAMAHQKKDVEAYILRWIDENESPQAADDAYKLAESYQEPIF